MRIKHISIKNCAGFTDFEADLGAIAIIQGANGKGKSAFLNCWKYLFQQGADPEMVSPEATGEITADFDTGDQIRAVITREKTVRQYKSAGTKRWVTKREFIDSVANAISYDPLAFLAKPDREQVAEVLKIMPIEISAAELQSALEPLGEDLGREIEASVDLAGRTPLDVLNTIRSAVFTRRTQEHVATDTHEKHASELAESLKALTVDGTDWEAEVRRLNAALSGYDLSADKLKDGLNAEIRLAISEAEGQCSKLMLLKEREVTDKISKLQAELASYKAECLSSRDQAIGAAKASARETFDKAAANSATGSASLREKLAQAEQSRKIQIESQSTQDNIARSKAAGVASRAKWKSMTAALEKIDELKATVAARLPLPCSFQDGRIVREENGVMIPLSKWNEASRYQFCLKLAVMAHGAAGFICIDSQGYGAFDSNNRRAFMAACKHYVEAEGLQFVIAQIGDSELTVTDATAMEV
jgi:hypothetical protein